MVVFSELTIDDFSAALASGESTPGGGAAAGLVARLSASLVRMVCHHTIGRPRYAEVEQRVAEIDREAAELDARARELMDADSAAFREVSAAYKLAKDDPARPQAVSEACKKATEVPLAVIRVSARLSELAEEVARIGNRTLKTDARTALVTALAAADASNGNVEANRGFITDAAWVERASAEASRLLGEIRRRV